MIISASRRTDIPAFYSDWFFNRLQEGFILVPNPFNPKRISQVTLHPNVVDCIVCWTKNPFPILNRLDRLQDYNYYFQFTLNSYGQDIEKKVPSLIKRIETFKHLSDKIGPDKVIWRYDPILTNNRFNTDFHKEAFAKIVSELNGYTERCMLGFIDHYSYIRKEMELLGINPLTMEEIREMALSFKESVHNTSIHLDTCTVKVNLSDLKIPSGMCIDIDLVERIVGHKIKAKKDSNQRDVCRCIESIDIGMYASCFHDCNYCYAIRNQKDLHSNARLHDKNSPLLIGNLQGDEIIKKREMKSLKDDHPSLF
ncbi:MAG: DUF1848 domain-containing protein [Bacteroidales bacterium]|nr:DUF1848 domain-containing protein [Bacteroidales bacterium]